MKCNQSRPGFELVSPCPIPATITITPRALPKNGCFCSLFFFYWFFFDISLSNIFLYTNRISCFFFSHRQSFRNWFKILYIYIYKVKLATVVECNLKSQFSIATKPRCSRGCYPFPRTDPLYPWSVTYNAECSARRHQVPFFESLVYIYILFQQFVKLDSLFGFLLLYK